MKTPTNNKPRRTYFNDAKLQESLNKAYIADALKRKEISKKFEIKEKQLFENFDKEKAGILKTADLKGFLNEKKKLDKKYSHIKQLDSNVLHSATATEYKDLLNKLYIKSNIDVHKITKLKVKFQDKYIKAFDTHFYPNRKKLETKEIKKNTDFNPPYRNMNESFRNLVATDTNTFPANVDNHYANAYGFANEQSGHIVLTSLLGLRGAPDSYYSSTNQTKSIFVKFVPETPGAVYLNFEQYIHQRLFTSINYNEYGYSDINNHLRNTRYMARLISPTTSGNWNIGNWNILLENYIFANTELDNTFAIAEGGTRQISNYYNIGSVTTSFVIIEFGIQLMHNIFVNDVSFSSSVFEHYEIEKIGVIRG